MLVVFTEKATNAQLTVHNSTFVNNTGRSGGGGVYLQLYHGCKFSPITDRLLHIR